MNFQSKLPAAGLSIFSEMTALAYQHGAVNLSQGFPDYDVDPYLIELVDQAMRSGHNQYAPMPGFMVLRERIAEKYEHVYQTVVHPDDEITLTAGGTQAIFTTIATLIHPGDEVIIFEPAYDCYRPTVELFGGKVIAIPLFAPTFSIDWTFVETKITDKTKLIIINNPGNPSCRLWSADDLRSLETLVDKTNVYILSDEVYEHLVFDGRKHESVLFYPKLRERSFVVASFGKLLHTTGWKLGYLVAAKELTKEFRKIHQFNVFSANAPMQVGIANYLFDLQYYQSLSTFFQEKRDFVIEGLAGSRFEVRASEGTYFILLNYEKLSSLPEYEYAVELTQRHKVALIPISAFYSENTQQKTLRLCFAKKQDTLERAISILKEIS